jgi:hypothetical protein
MAFALTLEEKKEKALAAQAKTQTKVEAATPAADGATRKRRNVFNGTQTKISVNQTIPGYHLHCFTDVGNRIQEALESGYEFVTPDEIGGVGDNVVSKNSDLGDRVRYLVNPRADGSEQFGYLMKVRSEWFEEDQKALAEKNNMIDAAIRKGKVTGGNPSFYVPVGGISIK